MCTLKSRQPPAFGKLIYAERNFRTIQGSDKPCPSRERMTTAMERKMISLRMGKGAPLSNVTGRPMAMARETMPRMPDQVMIKLVFESNRASSLMRGRPFCRLNCCR